MKTDNLGSCKICGKNLLGKRPDAQYCSAHCYNTRKRCPDKERSCKYCGKKFSIKERGDANRKYCSKSCEKKSTTKKTQKWVAEHPGCMDEYNKNRLSKNPGAWRDKSRQNRKEILSILGGKCIVCGADNPNWLHVDYIPTTRGAQYRHSRSMSYIRKNINLFRLLCANHHYELTLTGRIDGTDITQ